MISRELIRQVFAFAVVGIFATFVHYVVALFFVEAIDLNIFIASVFGYVSAVCVSLFGHGAFTYKKKVNRGIATRFVVVSLSAFALSEGILSVLEYQLALDHRYALLIVVLSIPIASFFFNKFWVYTEGHRR